MKSRKKEAQKFQNWLAVWKSCARSASLHSCLSPKAASTHSS
ncbi:hypothetical protein [Brucella abortus]